MERLRQPPRLALRALLGEQLQAATEAAARLNLSGETEALHDFRVALRRSHTLLRVYRNDLDHKLRLLNKRVRGLARATNALRDREVHIAWLREQHRQTPSTARAALAALIDELQNQQTRAEQNRYPQLQTRFAALAIDLCRCLQVPADALRSSCAGVCRHLRTRVRAARGRRCRSRKPPRAACGCWVINWRVGSRRSKLRSKTTMPCTRRALPPSACVMCSSRCVPARRARIGYCCG